MTAECHAKGAKEVLSVFLTAASQRDTCEKNTVKCVVLVTFHDISLGNKKEYGHTRKALNACTTDRTRRRKCGQQLDSICYNA